jgi:hypothetical protein
LLIPDQIAPWATGSDIAGLGIAIAVLGYELLLRRRAGSVPG